MRVIRKYVNRRLYDTSESRYINLEDLRRLIVEGENIRVTERSSGADITTTVLLQIIGESEKSGAPIFEPVFLCELIRAAAQNQDPSLPRRLTAAFHTVIKGNGGQRPQTPPAASF